MRKSILQVLIIVLSSTFSHAQTDQTIQLVKLVKEASDLVQQKGERAFSDFRQPGSKWKHEESYIFVLDPKGKMLVHPDKNIEGKNQLSLKDINGKEITKGLIRAATAHAGKNEGWYHYEWPVPGGPLPRWKSSYVIRVKSPSGNSYIVGSGMYNDQMERTFVMEAVWDAMALIKKDKDEAFRLFHDPTGPFIAKDAYIFIISPDGIEMVNPAHPNLEGRNVLDVKDTHGKAFVHEMLKTAETVGSGWVDYMWPKPGESKSTQKSTFVAKATTGDNWFLVGCGVYLPDAPTEMTVRSKNMSANELMSLVREAARILENNGETAFAQFREKGSKWFLDDTYFYVFSMDGTRIFHAAEPQSEGRNDLDLKDVLGRPMIRMFINAGNSPEGEGWVHYMWPEPGSLFPTWKSGFVKRVTLPSGKQYIIGSGIYNMQMEKPFVEDMVNRASSLLSENGKKAFNVLRDKKGPFVFMNSYVFVEDLNGNELVNAAHPSLEGTNLLQTRDLKGKQLVKDYIDSAKKYGHAWVEYYWYKPGTNQPVKKHSYVKLVRHKDETYIVGSGIYLNEGKQE